MRISTFFDGGSKALPALLQNQLLYQYPVDQFQLFH